MLIRVPGLQTPASSREIVTEQRHVGLSPRLLEEARETRPGRFLLELLQAVEYAGHQARPVLLRGKRTRGGFHLAVVVPIDPAKRPGEPPLDGLSVQGGEG